MYMEENFLVDGIVLLVAVSKTFDNIMVGHYYIQHTCSTVCIIHCMGDKESSHIKVIFLHFAPQFSGSLSACI